MRRKLPHKARRTMIRASDSKSTAASIYRLELQRDSLSKRRQFLLASLEDIESQMRQVEGQLHQLQTRQKQLFDQTSLIHTETHDDDDSLMLDY